MSTTKTEIKNKFVWQNPILDETGAEVISPITLVSVADLRPISMAERVRRYMRLPQFAQDQQNLNDLWADEDFDENLDPDEVPISQYEDRARELAMKVQARKSKENAEKSAKKAEEDKMAMEEWSKKYEELRQKGSAPHNSSPSSPPDAPDPQTTK